MVLVVSVCPSVCVSVFSRVSVCLSVQAITFELFHIGTSYLVWSYILIEVTFEYQGQGHVQKLLFTYFNLLFLCVWLHVINKVKVTHKGQGQIKVIF